ncbi:MAG: hypothetical protein KDB03_19100 [Planctomycetales bacterium]|nr:hypothetical protein [Planctomycetales bacterium]
MRKLAVTLLALSSFAAFGLIWVQASPPEGHSKKCTGGDCESNVGQDRKCPPKGKCGSCYAGVFSQNHGMESATTSRLCVADGVPANILQEAAGCSGAKCQSCDDEKCKSLATGGTQLCSGNGHCQDAGKCKLRSTTCEACHQDAKTKDESERRACPNCSSEDCKTQCSACKVLTADTKLEQTAPEAGHELVDHEHSADDRFVSDHEEFFFLLEHRDLIKRQVENLPNGIRTLTESSDAEVAAVIQQHVESMYDRIEGKNPIRMRDPIFRAIFANADKINMEVKHTTNGVEVTETSDDAYVAKLLQAHAKVVNLFIQNGFSEMPRNHATPE